MIPKSGRAWDAVLMERASVAGQNRKGYAPGSNRLLIALTYWEGDRKAAEKLATFLADLEPEHTDRADFLLAHRFDCPAPNAQLVQHLSRKFNVFVHKSDRCAVGWPQGCNGTWASTMRWVKKGIESKVCPAYKAVFCCEADGGPCVRNWIEEMSLEWDNAEAQRPTYQAGPLVTIPAQHINGNCLLSCDPKFLKWVANFEGNLTGGWDFVLAHQFRRWGWANIERMRSYYNTPMFSAAQYLQMRKERLIWVHGDKGGCLIDYGRKSLMEERHNGQK